MCLFLYARIFLGESPTSGQPDPTPTPTPTPTRYIFGLSLEFTVTGGSILSNQTDTFLGSVFTNLQQLLDDLLSEPATVQSLRDVLCGNDCYRLDIVIITQGSIDPIKNESLNVNLCML